MCNTTKIINESDTAFCRRTRFWPILFRKESIIHNLTIYSKVKEKLIYNYNYIAKKIL